MTISQKYFISYYLWYSLMASLFLWAGYHILTPTAVLLDNFFLCSLVVVNYYYLSRSSDLWTLKVSGHLSIYLLAQIICLIGMSFEIQLISPIYLCFIPLMSSLYLLVDNKLEQKFTNLGLISILSVFTAMQLGFAHRPKHSLSLDFLFLTGFTLWTLGTSYGWLARGKNLFKLIFNQLDKNVDFGDSGTQLKDRLFFHDLINQTHGVSLFLTYKSSMKEGLSSTETESINQEIKTLQSLIKDHFQMGHKNLIRTHDTISFEELKPFLSSLIYNFLPPHHVSCQLEFFGWLADERAATEQCLIDFPKVSRILTNVVKNMAESGTRSVKMEFDYNDNGFMMKLSNQIMKLAKGKNFLKNIEDYILYEKNDDVSFEKQGAGLESVSFLCQVMGGSFNFKIEGERWINEIQLPHPQKNQFAKSA